MSLQILINGIATGSIYALIATGFALIFNILKNAYRLNTARYKM